MKITNMFSTIRRRLFFDYSYYWEEGQEDEYDNIGDDEDILIIESQECIDPTLISGEDLKDVQFPWHGHTEKDFVYLNKRLEKCLSENGVSGGKKVAKKIKRKYPDVFDAYFQAPIKVLFEVESGTFSFMSDGRHRIIAAQKCSNRIPVWICRYYKKAEITKECFLHNEAHGNWRFGKE